MPPIVKRTYRAEGHKQAHIDGWLEPVQLSALMHEQRCLTLVNRSYPTTGRRLLSCDLEVGNTTHTDSGCGDL